ncbi:hypothetical protein MPH48_15385 [Lysinibacillus fusiformis]|uniref:hypothetical protein n=1 Tax=Lysinibacillus fusiformis TaxID=28031 RepID=UPI001F4EC159|nr:hypothetical protein [Lysinibacillus fusiformis]MCK1989478.1 hypothetical protein [Lysinibacillus fusiformis]
MTIYSGIFNSVNGDRKYNAWWFAKYFATFIGNGVFPNPSSNLQVAAYQNMKVVVKPGSGWIDGYFILSDGDHVLSLDVADGVLKRIDRVVMRLNHLTRKIDLVVKKGTFASSPVAPTLQRDADAYELALADVLINNGVTQITQANITDQRLNSTLCGIVHGTVNQVDTTTIFNQYQAWFAQTTQNVAIDLEIWKQHTKDDFDTWFDSIKGILDGDVAGNLAAHIAQLEVDFSNHDKDVIRHNNYGRATGTNALIITSVGSSKPITAYTEGMSYKFKNTTTNTSGTMTVNIDGVGVKNLRRNGNLALPVGAMKAGGIYNISYDGTVFTLTDEGGEYGDAIAGDVRKGKTIGTINGLVTGTLDLTNLKPENLRRGVTIDGVVGVIDITHGKIDTYTDIQNTTVRRDNGKVHRQTDDGGRVSLEVTGNDSNNTMKFQVIHRNALGIATNTVTLPEPSNKYYTYIDTVRHGFVQVARQFDRVTEYDWTTGIAVRTIFVTTNFYNPSALIAIEPFMNSNDLKVIGNKGDISGSRYGIFNTSMVMEHSMTAYYAGGYGMTRLLQKNVWLITADTWSGIVNRENNAWRETWLNSNDGSAGTVLGFAELLTNIGRKI